MKTILVVSDTHGDVEGLKQALKRCGRPDLLIHLGDCEGHVLHGGQQNVIERLADCPVEIVKGNNDIGADLPYEKLITIGRHRAFLTHGHRYMLHCGPATLVNAAKSRDADIAMFGHTHVPELFTMNGVTVLNPGSISQPRQYGRRETYCVIEVDDNGDLNFRQEML